LYKIYMVHIHRKNIKVLSEASKGVGLGVNAEKMKYKIVSSPKSQFNYNY